MNPRSNQLLRANWLKYYPSKLTTMTNSKKKLDIAGMTYSEVHALLHPRSKKKVVKGFAVVPRKEWAYGALLVFNSVSESFSYGVFPQESFAQKYADRNNQSLKSKRNGEWALVVPCVITYSLPPKSK